jgi:hypothetical protein
MTLTLCQPSLDRSWGLTPGHGQIARRGTAGLHYLARLSLGPGLAQPLTRPGAAIFPYHRWLTSAHRLSAHDASQ